MFLSSNLKDLETVRKIQPLVNSDVRLRKPQDKQHPEYSFLCAFVCLCVWVGVCVYGCLRVCECFVAFVVVFCCFVLFVEKFIFYLLLSVFFVN